MKNMHQLKVIELASVLAGPLCGSFFSELGAQVIKIEKPDGGDITRSWKIKGESLDAPLSSYYAAANYNKTVIRLDLNKEEDKQILFQEMESCDVLISNFKFGDDIRYGLVAEGLALRFPRLIHGIISGFTDQAERSAFDLVLQAEAGYISMTGTDENHLAKIPIALIDVLAAHQLKEGMLLALMQRGQSGKGAIVRVSLYDSALSALINQGSAALMLGSSPIPTATLHPSIAPYGEILICSDKTQLILAVGNNKQFQSLCQVLGIEHIGHQESYRDNPARVKNRFALVEDLNAAAKNFKGTDLYQNLLKLQVPVGKIMTLQEVISSEAAQSLVLENEQENQVLKRFKGNVFRIESNP